MMQICFFTSGIVVMAKNTTIRLMAQVEKGCDRKVYFSSKVIFK